MHTWEPVGTDVTSGSEFNLFAGAGWTGGSDNGDDGSEDDSGRGAAIDIGSEGNSCDDVVDEDGSVGDTELFWVSSTLDDLESCFYRNKS